ncbi:hypothetical protein GQ44DRAFT_822159 [Phaeosphaeriaceae sp. PMI808]|nr:hypothetical protein GQ44DRAFT_822159 [Phaeosphaeriaceae sp. PMI808]
MSSVTLSNAEHGLPAELVVLIVDHLAGDNKTLCALAQTCRALQHLAEELIYKVIILSTVRNLRTIIDAFVRRMGRAHAVQILKLQYHYNPQELDDYLDIRMIFDSFLSHMVNLREWYIESPYNNSGHWEEGDGPEQWIQHDMVIFQEMLDTACTEGPPEAVRIQAESRLGNQVERTVGLARLEQLTIHSHGTSSEFWNLNDFHCIFRHPSLQYLHISCVSLTRGIPALESHNKTTPLRTLIFDECEITPASLRSILRTPANLQNLTLGENVWNTNRSRVPNPILTKNATATLEALSSVAHSLERLTHLDPGWKINVHSERRSPPMLISGDGMRNFHALKYMQCELGSFLYRAIIMNHALAPPNLETLRLSSNMFSENYFNSLPVADIYLALPSLSTLQLMQASDQWQNNIVADYISAPARLRARHAFAYKLFKAGINLQIFVEMHKTLSTIPPYLAGEVTPQVQCLYDADVIGFHRYLGDQENNPSPDTSPVAPLPETDQLRDSDIKWVNSSARHDVRLIRQRFRDFGDYMDRDIEDDEDDVEDGSVEIDFDNEVDLDDMELDNDIIVTFDEDGNMYLGVDEAEWESDMEDEADLESDLESDLEAEEFQYGWTGHDIDGSFL